MPDIDRKLLTIVTEALLESELCEAIESLGATGYTVTNARGSGSRGVRDAGWTSSGNIRVEVVCSPELAEQLADHLRRKYYDDYAMIIFESNVRVLRPEKFT
jgi:nitrogen regulatory protein PII